MSDQPHDSTTGAKAPLTSLLAIIPSTSLVLRRTQTTLEVLCGVVQESSAEYWYERGKAAAENENWAKALYAFRQCVGIDKHHWRSLLYLAVAVSSQQVRCDEVPNLLLKAYECHCPYVKDVLVVYESNIEQWFTTELTPQNWHIIRTRLQSVPVSESNDFYNKLAVVISNLVLKNSTSLREELKNIEATYPIEARQTSAFHRLEGLAWRMYTESLVSNDRAIELDPENSFLYLERGLLLGVRVMYPDEFDNAIADYDKAIILNPTLLCAYFSRGVLKHKKGDFAGAVKDFTSSIDLSPGYAFFYNSRAEAKCGLRKYQDALTDYNQAINLNTDKAEFYINRAWCRGMLQDITGANNDLGKGRDLGWAW